MIVFVADQNSFARSPHSMKFIVFFQALQACKYRRVFLRLIFFGAKGVVAEGIEPDCFGLIGGKGFWEHWPAHELRWKVARIDLYYTYGYEVCSEVAVMVDMMT